METVCLAQFEIVFREKSSSRKSWVLKFIEYTFWVKLVYDEAHSSETFGGPFQQALWLTGCEIAWIQLLGDCTEIRSRKTW